MTKDDRADILKAIAAQNEHRMQMSDDLKDLASTLKEFKETYLHDMRGEGKVNGYKGLIGEVQFVKDEIIKHPSFARYIATDPAKAVAAIVGAFVGAVTLWFALHAIAGVPAVEAWFQRWLGL